MRTYRTQDFHRIRSDKHRLYYACGVPYRFWDEKPGEPTFTQATWGSSKATVKMQEDWFAKLVGGKPFTKPHLVLFASDPTDETALAHAFQLCKVVVREPPREGVMRRIQIDVASEEIRADTHNATCDVFVLHNVLAKADRARVTVVRDWVKKHEDVFRLIVIAGTPDDFRHTYGLEPNAIFMFGDTTIQRSMKSFG